MPSKSIKPFVLIFNLVLFIILFASHYLNAQSNMESSINPSLLQYSPKSPNVGALLKFGEYEVGYSTGVPKISIPIYSYKGVSNGLNLDISLDYHAGGIKVSEESSDVGIGWALSAGGIISRQIRGVYDEMTGGGFINASRLPFDEVTGNSPAAIEYRPFNDIDAMTLDGQCDIFNFSFNGRSGKFILGKHNDLLLLTKQKLKIEKVITTPSNIPGLTDPVITQFTITDEFGYRFIFKDLEVTLDNSLIGLTAKIYPSSWYLSEIRSPKSDAVITFNYEDTYIPEKDFTLSYTDAYKVYPLINTQSPQLWESPPSSPSLNIHGKRLKEINFPGGIEMVCTYNSEYRQDLEAGNEENSLAKLSISDGKNKRGYKLYQDYSLNRLTLLKVNFLKGLSEAESTGYSFEYFLTPQGTKFPPKNSRSQDHWGYLNSNGGSMIPHEIFPNGIYLGRVESDGYGNMLPLLEFEISGGNRDTDSLLCKTGSLKRIKYPTGGYTDFVMEANTATHNWLDQRGRRIIPEHYELMDRGGYVSLGNGTNEGTQDFVFTGKTGTNQITIKVPSASSAHCNSGNCSIHAEIRNSNGNYLGAGSGSFIPQGSSFTFNCTMTNSQSYTIRIYQYGIEDFMPYIAYRWKEDVLIPADTTYFRHHQPYVGGLRVQKIINYDSDGKILTAKEYQYVKNNGESSGALGVYPTYTYSTKYAYRDGYSQPDGGESYNPAYKYVFRTNSPTYTAYTNGSPVNYSRVIETFKSNSDSIGRIERLFTSFDNAPTNVKAFPFVPIDVPDWHYGLLTDEITYNKQGKILSHIINNYDLKQDRYYEDTTRFENFRSISIAPVKTYNPGFDGVNLAAPKVYFLMSSFDPHAGYAELLASKRIQYSDKGDSLVSLIDYSYDQDNLYKLSETRRNSMAKVEKMNYLYPKEMIAAGMNPNNIFTGMIDQNMIGTIVQQKLTKDQTSVKLSMINFGKINTNMFLPKSIDVQNMNYSEKTTLNFNHYDIHGNLLEQQKANDTKEVYIWGYNGQFPVAKITGTDYESAKILIDQNKLDNAFNYTDEQLRAELNKLRSGLKHAMVSTYTYAPLFGITSETDPTGQTSYYEYDGQGRLKVIKNSKGMVIKTYNYNYRK